MIRIVVALVWIGLILATALTRQVVANWVLSAGLAVYLLLRWRSRRARIASRRLPSHTGNSQPGSRGNPGECPDWPTTDNIQALAGTESLPWVTGQPFAGPLPHTA